MLLEINTRGVLEKIMTFTLAGPTYDMLSYPQNLIFANDHFLMSGSLTGF